MNRLPMILSGLLVLQIVGAVALAVSGPDYSAYEASDPLVAFNVDAVDEISIEDGTGQSVVLKREDDGWILPALHDFPADLGRVTKLLSQLNGLKRGLPVALTSSAPERFKVTEDVHERRVVLRGGDKTLGEVLFGTSPSYRQVHVRTPEDDAVYSVAFAIYDAGPRPDDWMNRNYLKIPEDKITKIELPDLTLVRTDEGFTVDGLAEGEEVVKDEMSNLVRKLAKPAFISVEGRGEEALARVDEPDATATLMRGDADAVTYRLKKIDDKDEYLFASSEHDYLFRVAKFAVAPILEASRDKLVKSTATNAGAHAKRDNPSGSKGTTGDSVAPDQGSG